MYFSTLPKCSRSHPHGLGNKKLGEAYLDFGKAYATLLEEICDMSIAILCYRCQNKRNSFHIAKVVFLMWQIVLRYLEVIHCALK